MVSVVEGHAHGACLLEVICGHLKIFGGVFQRHIEEKSTALIIDGCLTFVGRNGEELDENDRESKKSSPLLKKGRHTACVLMCL